MTSSISSLHHSVLLQIDHPSKVIVLPYTTTIHLLETVFFLLLQDKDEVCLGLETVFIVSKKLFISEDVVCFGLDDETISQFGKNYFTRNGPNKACLHQNQRINFTSLVSHIDSKPREVKV